ncbi:MAG: HEAT repeat domain-containing protein [Egibacteraceae bacterium]
MACVPTGDPTGGRSVPYLFLHRTFHEYLVARHLSRQPPEHWSQAVEAHRWLEPEWDEVIAMLAGLLPEPTPLLRALTDCPDDPFHISLYHAGRAVAELRPEQARSEHPTDIVDRLLKFLGGPDPELETGTRILNRLVSVGNPHAIAALVVGLDDPDDSVGWTAAGALQSTADPQAVTARLDHPDRDVRLMAAWALQGTTDPQAAAALIAQLDDADAVVRRAAVLALSIVEDLCEARERCASVLDRWTQASSHLREQLYTALAALAPKAYRAVPSPTAPRGARRWPRSPASLADRSR